jgi:hypothetical protein
LVTFDESGLPSGTSWSVVVAGTNYNLTSLGTVGGSPVEAYLQNGTYDYGPYTPTTSNTNYTAPAGSFTISGSGLTIEVTFSKTDNSDPSDCGGTSVGEGWGVTEYVFSACLTAKIYNDWKSGDSLGTVCAVALLVDWLGGALCATLVLFLWGTGVWISIVAAGGGIWEKAWEGIPYAIGANEGSW